MDYYIRMGLLVGWALFGLAALIWWQRRHGSRKYSYTERAQVILDAIQAHGDLGMIYWSKSEKKFIRRVVTPEELDGYSMRGFDHTLGRPRIFKVTRIRLIELIPPGGPKAPPSRLKLISWPTVTTISLGCLVLIMLALALIRGRGPAPMAGEFVPVIEQPGATSAVPPVVSQTVTADVPVRPVLPVVVDSNDFLNAPPVPLLPTETWYVVVETHPKYKTGQVSGGLQAVLRCRPERAAELEKSVQALGRAVVWSGEKKRATGIQRMLENYDLLAALEAANADSTNSLPAGTP